MISTNASDFDQKYQDIYQFRTRVITRLIKTRTWTSLLVKYKIQLY